MSMSRIPTVALVDAYSSGRHLAPIFRSRGYACLHIRTTPDVPPVYASTFRPADFIAEIVHGRDLDATLAEVAAYRPAALLTGVESGVELADALSERLGLRTNGTVLSPARRDKALMIDTVRAAGLRVVRQLESRDWAAISTWYRTIGGRVVLKPVRSLGNDGVFFCDDEDQARSAFERILGSRSVLTERNHTVLAQEYVYGTEYAVNTVSLDSEHRVTDIWEQQHLHFNGVRDLLGGSRLLAAGAQEHDRLTPYVFAVLDALGIRNGPAHTEVRLTPDGPCLIEVGARLSGADIPVLVGKAIGTGQLELTADVYVDPGRFRSGGSTNAPRRHAANVHLLSPFAGRLAGYPRLGQIAELESFHEAKEYVSPGESIARSVNDFTYPVVVRLLHSSEGVVRRDMASIRQLDGDGFYALEP